MARTAAARIAEHLSGEDKRVSQRVIDNLPKGATEDFLVAPPNAKNVTPMADALAASVGLPAETDVAAAMAEAGARNKAAQSAARKAKATAIHEANRKAITPKPKAVAKAKAAAKPAPKAKVVKAKAEPKPRAVVTRIPAAQVIALIDELKITRTQLGQAAGKSASLVSEWVGKGRGREMAADQWPAVEKAARAFAKKAIK